LLLLLLEFLGDKGRYMAKMASSCYENTPHLSF